MEFAIRQRARVGIDDVPLTTAVEPDGGRITQNFANSSVLATFGSCVWSIFTFFRPRFFQLRGWPLFVGHDLVGIRLPPAVGTTTNLASGPPPSSMNFSMMVVPSVEPPPTMTSVPLAGPYRAPVAVCAGLPAPCCHAAGVVRLMARRKGSWQ